MPKHMQQREVWHVFTIEGYSAYFRANRLDGDVFVCKAAAIFLCSRQYERSAS
jgi:hypothetical protein